jgi:hypothetical protein
VSVVTEGQVPYDSLAERVGHEVLFVNVGERLRRLTRRLGGTKAMCAVGRSILVIIWHLLADPEARFTDLGPGWHDQQAGRDRKIRSHLRQLKALGIDVTVNPAA